MPPRRFPFGVAFAAACSVLAGTSANAVVNRVWIHGAGTSNWATGTNWSPTGPPQTGDAVFVTSVDSFTKTVIFDGFDFGLPNQFQSILIDESGPGRIMLEQFGLFLGADRLMIGGGGPGFYDFEAGSAQFGAGTIINASSLTILSGASMQAGSFAQNNGTVSVFGAFTTTNYTLANGTLFVDGGGSFGGGNFTQTGGIVSNGAATLSFSGTYAFNGGTFDGGSQSLGAVSAGTFIDNVGTFNGTVDANKLVVNGNGTFLGSVSNHSALTVPAGQTIFIHRNFDQIGGTVTHSGFVGGQAPGGLSSDLPTVTVGGGANWNQNAGVLQGVELIVGSGNGGPGTYSLSGTGSINVSSVSVGPTSDGTIVQNGGLVQASGVALGGRAGPIRGGPLPPGQRGYYSISAGTLLASGLIVGTQDCLLGQFTQSGGDVELDQLICNINSTTTGIINVSGGSMTVADASVNNGSFNQSGGVAIFRDFLDGAGSITVTGTGSLTLKRMRQNSLFVGGNGQVALFGVSIGTIGSNNTTTSRVHSLGFEQAGNVINGSFDLAGNSLVVDYDGSVSPAANIRRYLISGYAGGAWNGTGLNSRGGAAQDAGHHTALGYGEASEILGPSGGVFQGLTVDNTAILVRLTWYGDANLDGRVDTLDFNALAANFGKTGQRWNTGDFNYDGSVDTLDFNSFASNFGKALFSEVSATTSLLAIVPEPLTGSICIATALLFAPRRRNRCYSRHCG